MLVRGETTSKDAAEVNGTDLLTNLGVRFVTKSNGAAGARPTRRGKSSVCRHPGERARETRALRRAAAARGGGHGPDLGLRRVLSAYKCSGGCYTGGGETLDRKYAPHPFHKRRYGYDRRRL